MVFVDASHGWAMGLVSLGADKYDQVLQATHDGGESWHQVTLPEIGNYFWMHFFNLRDGLILSDNFSITHDGGLTWQKRDEYSRSVETVGDRVWAIQDTNCIQTTHCNQALVVSSNKGATWQPSRALPSAHKDWQIS